LTFDQYADKRESIDFKGDEIIALYLALVEQEDRLDRFQLAALERLRSSLYGNLSVEQMEDLVESYSARLSNPRV
jgi:uncharacterized Zn finger protein